MGNLVRKPRSENKQSGGRGASVIWKGGVNEQEEIKRKSRAQQEEIEEEKDVGKERCLHLLNGGVETTHLSSM